MIKNKKWILVSGAIIFFLVLSLYFDSYITRAISYIKNGFLDDFLIGLTFTSFEIIVFLFLTGIFLASQNKRKWVFPLWFSFLLSYAVSFILKIAIQRPRPFQQGLIEISSFLVKNSYYVWDFSFPSNHAMLAFCALPFLSKEFPKFKYVWIVLAVLVGFSRVYFGFHFLSDVIAGAAIGYLLGALIIRAEKENKFWENLYWKIYNMFVK